MKGLEEYILIYFFGDAGSFVDSLGDEFDEFKDFYFWYPLFYNFRDWFFIFDVVG